MLSTLPPLSLYVHIPWCVRKCPYCDFNSHQRPEVLPEARYVEALISDLEHDLPLVWGRSVVSIFMGGGTPSLFSGASIARLLDGVRARLSLRPDAEITMECNPGTAEFDFFERYRDAGVNRLSFGVQSFDDRQLAKLGRIHSANEATEAFDKARRAGFDNINLDLMYALPGQSLEDALSDLEQALSLAPEHLSHYHLTCEPNTVFAARPPKDLPDDDTAFAMQDACQARLRAAGFQHYEVSAYARPHRMAAHNLNYWRFGDYLGIGAGAHGKISSASGIQRFAKQKIPRLYMETAGSDSAIQSQQTLSAQQLPFEFALNAWRLTAGFAETDFELRTGLKIADVKAFARAQEKGLISREQGWLQATELGQRFLNDLMMLFLD